MSVRDRVNQLEDVIRSANPTEVVRALRRVYPDVDWPGPNRSPRIHIDVKKLEKLASLYVTIGEAASVLGVSRSTLTRRLREPAYHEAWERGRTSVKIALRRKQIEVALGGDNTMLIWLGKQILGQHEPVEEPPACRDWDQPTIDLDEFERMMDETEAELHAEFDGGDALREPAASSVPEKASA